MRAIDTKRRTLRGLCVFLFFVRWARQWALQNGRTDQDVVSEADSSGPKTWNKWSAPYDTIRYDRIAEAILTWHKSA